MANASIACTGLTTQVFDTCRGAPLNPFEETYQDITRPNLDGVAFKLFGMRSAPTSLYTMVGVSHNTWDLSTVDALFLAYAAFVNNINLATFTDETGTVYNSVRVLRVEPWIQDNGHPYRLLAAQQGLDAKSLGNPLICVYAAWLIQRTVL